MKKLNVTFCSFPDFSSNAKPLYEYMKKKYNDKMNLVWIVRADKIYAKLKNMNIKVYKLGSPEYFEYVKTTDVFFTTHADITGDKPKNSLYIELWHGIGCKKAGFIMDELDDSTFKWYDSIKKKIDYFILPNDFWATIFSAIFNIKRNRILTLGYPKFDNFINKNAKEDLSKILDIDVSKFSKIIYYTPTFKRGCSRQLESNININNLIDLNKYDETILINYLKDNNYLLCIKKHPSDEVNYNLFENDNIKIINDEKLLEKEITINEILDAADLLISDFSSLVVEFSFLNKPIICIDTNLKSYSKNRGIVFENYNFWTLGMTSNNINSLIENINKAFNEFDPNNESYKLKRNLWIGNLKDGGCKKICDYLFEENKISDRVCYYKDIEDILDEKINNLYNRINEKDIMIKEQNEQLNTIFNSRGWKLLEKFRKLKNKIKLKNN